MTKEESKQLLNKALETDGEYVRTRISADERESIYGMALAFTLMDKTISGLSRRLKTVKHGNWYTKTARATWFRAYGEVMKTISAEQLPTLARNLECMSYTFGVKPVTKNDYGIYLTYDQLAGLVDAAKAECITCALDKQAMRSCKLKKTFDSLPLVDQTVTSGGTCAYFDEYMGMR